MDIERHGTTRRYSDIVTHGNTIYLVEVPETLMVTIYLSDMREYAAMNDVWDAWVPEGTAPVRACVEARLANPGYRVEMVVTAAR